MDCTCSEISGQPVAQGGRQALIEGEYRIFFTPRALDDLDELI